MDVLRVAKPKYHIFVVDPSFIPGSGFRVSSHPTVGVALYGPKVFDRLSSLSEEPPVGIKILLVCSF